MKKLVRLAFLLPAFIAATPAVAAPRPGRLLRPAIASPKATARAPQQAPLHYVTLDRMIHSFAEQAHASRNTHRDIVIAQR